MVDLSIEVICLAKGREVQRNIEVSDGTTLGEAVDQSGIIEQFPDFDIVKARKGIFGTLRSESWLLKDRDRVEIYQPLIFDPREARRRRAATQG
tara:strand:+ start:99 stop:380 length:282 start_codon:yes stop_codon:yes gene_type:complete